MNINKALGAVAIAASALTLSGFAGAGSVDNNPKIYGAPAAAATATRIVEITASTRYVNVVNGDTVTFIINGKSFTWTFDLYHQEGTLDLSMIAPGELHATSVRIYVAGDPTYR